MRRALVEFADALTVSVVPDVSASRALDVALVHAKALAALEPHRAFAARFAPLFSVGGVDVMTFARERATQCEPRHAPERRRCPK